MSAWLPFALLSLVLYGLWGFFPKMAGGHLGSRSILLSETIGTIVVGLVVLATLHFRPEVSAKGISYALIAGLAGALGSLCFLLALARGKVSLVVTTTALYPMVVILLAALFLKEPITLRQGAGMVMALVSVVMMSL